MATTKRGRKPLPPDKRKVQVPLYLTGEEIRAVKKAARGSDYRQWMKRVVMAAAGAA